MHMQLPMAVDLSRKPIYACFATAHSPPLHPTGRIQVGCSALERVEWTNTVDLMLSSMLLNSHHRSGLRCPSAERLSTLPNASVWCRRVYEEQLLDYPTPYCDSTCDGRRRMEKASSVKYKTIGSIVMTHTYRKPPTKFSILITPR